MTQSRAKHPASGAMLLANLLRDFRGPIIARWCHRVLTDPAVPEANRLSMPLLQDHIPALIDRLVGCLERSAQGTTSGERSGRNLGHGEESRAHAEERFREGYSLAAALRELSHVRAAIMDVCTSEGVLVDGEGSLMLHAALDETMSETAVGMEQAAVRKFERAQDALRRDAEFRERFIAVLGHDLRQPLSAVMFGSAALLKQDALPDEQVRTLRRIHSSTERANRMVRDLLDFARAGQGGGIPIERGACDLSLVCEHAIEEARAANAGRRAIEFRCEGDTKGSWDADRVAQVVANLVGNAIEHGAAESPVRVSVRGSEREVAIEVHNDGEPITLEVQARIFDPFRQAGAAQRVTRGLGLGLYIADAIVRAHDGAITLSSDAARGTTFCVTLPR